MPKRNSQPSSPSSSSSHRRQDNNNNSSIPQRRRNGLSPPYSKAQIASWIALGSSFGSFLLFATPIMSWPVSLPVTVVFVLLAFGAVAFGTMTILIDPTDLYLLRHWSDHAIPITRTPESRCLDALYRRFNHPNQRDTQSLPANEPMKYCWICDVEVAEPSMHCKFCNKCVRNFDHHCMWLNTCVGTANYLYFVRTMIVLVALECTQFVVHLYLIIDIFLDGPSKQRANDWWISPAVNAFLIFFACFSFVSILTVGQLLVFHMKLQRQRLTTYRFIVQEHAAKREMAKRLGDLEASRIAAITKARQQKATGQVLRLHLGGLCREWGCAVCDVLELPPSPSAQTQEQQLDELPAPRVEDIEQGSFATALNAKGGDGGNNPSKVFPPSRDTDVKKQPFETQQQKQQQQQSVAVNGSAHSGPLQQPDTELPSTPSTTTTTTPALNNSSNQSIQVVSVKSNTQTTGNYVSERRMEEETKEPIKSVDPSSS